MLQLFEVWSHSVYSCSVFPPDPSPVLYLVSCFALKAVFVLCPILVLLSVLPFFTLIVYPTQTVFTC